MIIVKEDVTLIHTNAQIPGLPKTEQYETLSDEDKTRVNRFQQAGKQHNFIVRRGMLRNLL